MEEPHSFGQVPWVYATGQFTLAKSEGIYSTPEEGMEQRLLWGLEDTAVNRVEIQSAGPNLRDGKLPHVWYVIGRVWADNEEDGISATKICSGGSYFLRIEDVWVHMSEGAFPDFVG